MSESKLLPVYNMYYIYEIAVSQEVWSQNNTCISWGRQIQRQYIRKIAVETNGVKVLKHGIKLLKENKLNL